jgi:uncharacterized membrane protein (DUF441 family)
MQYYFADDTTSEYYPLIQQHGLNIGIIILTIAVLVPIASGRISGESIFKSFLSQIITCYRDWRFGLHGGRGVKLMSNQPDVVAGLLVGTVAGVALLRGVPVGPLIAAGLLTLIIGTGQP